MIHFINTLLQYPDCIFPNTWNKEKQTCSCWTTFATSETNCTVCTKCDYDGILADGKCSNCDGRDPKLCCNKCNNIAQDAQNKCKTCADIYADYNFINGSCYGCITGAEKVQLPASMGGSKVCTQKALVKEGKKISLIVGIIYAIITFIFVVINVWRCVKNRKKQ
ncbi:Hypothetical_protein [Hexamita inflata]|uniref:Hypothetical_protein n=1 Tax=Hexamita inflata TaxID=28002 RepID=A0AA86QBG8_9EUKA|nr:Hypothetical protein HINF_LOCUS43415 [Hexamita inflata]